MKSAPPLRRAPRLATLLALGAALWAPGAGAANPRCFGAASRDVVHRCVNPALARIVVPRPDRALLLPDSQPCRPLPEPLHPCLFGAPPASGRRVVALVGDSHAAHWGAAVDVVARRLNWTVLALTHPSCSFTSAIPLAGRARDTRCVAWNQAVQQWLAQHPQVSAIVTSDHPAPVETRPHQSLIAAWVSGYLSAWSALPASVAHVVVIRDVPFASQSVLDCVGRALRRHLDAGRRCAFRRAAALHHDPDVLAAQQLAGSRVQVVDLTRYFCGPSECYPVIGGALVYRDLFSHITSVYARTLGPYLLAGIERAMMLWR